MYMKIAICEDEQWFALSLKEKVESFCASKNADADVAIFSDGGSFLAACEGGEYFDAVFMDINLGSGTDGVDTIAKLRENGDSVPVVFVTSLENRAVDGYDVSAFGFVVKKNCNEKLPLVLEKLWKKLYVRKTVTVTTKEGAIIINTGDILYAESDGRSTLIHTMTEDISDTRSIGIFSSLLDSNDFIEVYKSIFVNISRIRRINADTLVLENDAVVPLSRRNRKNVMYAVMRKVDER